MEALIAFGIAVALLVTVDLIAVRFGVDSRDEVADDRHRPFTPSWM